MSFPVIEALARTIEDGGVEVCAPGPGKVRWARRPGEGLLPGSRVGLLRRDDRTFELVLPVSAAGRVQEILLADPWSRCEHGQPLARLGAMTDLPDLSTGPGETRGRDDAWQVRSPTHGTFYARPAPGEPSYVSPGGVVVRGQTLGLVEVMKCFSPILFEPPEGTDRGVVVEVLASDASEVQADQVLLSIDISGSDSA